MRDGSGLPARERATLRRKKEYERTLRAEEAPLVAPWRDFMLRLVEDRALTQVLLAKRCEWNFSFQRENFFREGCARPPSDAEAETLAQALNLRGQEKAEFHRLAREAREAIAKKRRMPRAEQREMMSEGVRLS